MKSRLNLERWCNRTGCILCISVMAIPFKCVEYRCQSIGRVQRVCDASIGFMC
jgi:hypothetical protein